MLNSKHTAKSPEICIDVHITCLFVHKYMYMYNAHNSITTTFYWNLLSYTCTNVAYCPNNTHVYTHAYVYYIYVHVHCLNMHKSMATKYFPYIFGVTAYML